MMFSHNKSTIDSTQSIEEIADTCIILNSIIVSRLKLYQLIKPLQTIKRSNEQAINYREAWEVFRFLRWLTCPDTVQTLSRQYLVTVQSLQTLFRHSLDIFGYIQTQSRLDPDHTMYYTYFHLQLLICVLGKINNSLNKIFWFLRNL